VRRLPSRTVTSPGPRIDASFFARDTREVARDLIGVTLAHGETSGVIVETEAYRGDPASHFVTRPRTGRIMGTTCGALYVYRIYGMHRCMNVTTELDHPGAVLIRALAPAAGIDRMRERRPGRADRELTSGPARLFVALGLSDGLNGRPFDETLTWTRPAERAEVVSGPRIGIRQAVDLPWRFLAVGNPHVSHGGSRRLAAC
jgi:DNA-3-methyladenine glycosylase